MLRRLNLVGFLARNQGSQGAGARRDRDALRRFRLERLEDRQVLASILPITGPSVPSLQGMTIPLEAAAGTSNQTFTVTSSNPDIAASIASGPFWTINISYTDPKNSQNDFSGPLTFQLFQNLTPNTVHEIETFTNDGWYTNKFITRVASGFPNATDFVVQGGAPNRDGTGSSGQPGTPFANENLQQLAFTGTEQLAMANAGYTTPTNDTQFFITTGSPNSELGYNYTIFGQMVSGMTTLAKITQVPVTQNPVTQENSYPVNPVNITSASLSTGNPNGVLILDTTQARPGEKSTITVTATDAQGHTASVSFQVTVVPYNGPTTISNGTSGTLRINFRPFANSVTATTTLNTETGVTLSGQSTFPSVPAESSTLTYNIVTQPQHGTITNFNPNTGTLVYTPNKGFQGNDSFTYSVTGHGPLTTSPTTTVSNPATVTIEVGATSTGAVIQVGRVLMVTPPPRYDKGLNTIFIRQVPNPAGTGPDVIQVTVNGVLDSTQPAISNLDSIEVFGGGRANNDIVVDPSVTVPVTLSGGHGLRNYITGGSGPSREHGWFGLNLLIAGPGPNQLIGRAGHVKFRPNKESTVIFLGSPSPRTPKGNLVPPTGTFYKFVHGHLIPVGHLPKVGRHRHLFLMHAPFRLYSSTSKP